ncbi:MAG: TetR family transcriptional regulator [Sneathiellaceae bacterium]
MPPARPPAPPPGSARTADPRFLRSLDALLAAVTALVDEAPLAGLSITRVVKAAGVTRPTFYQHFASVEEAAQRAALARLSAAYPPREPARPGGTAPGPAPSAPALTEAEVQDRIERHALPILRHLLAHRPFYLRVLEGAGTAAFFDALVAFLSARLLPAAFAAPARRSGADPADMLTMHAGGIMWLVIRWLRGEAGQEPAEAMARRLARAATAIRPPAAG